MCNLQVLIKRVHTNICSGFVFIEIMRTSIKRLLADQLSTYHHHHHHKPLLTHCRMKASSSSFNCDDIELFAPPIKKTKLPHIIMEVVKLVLSHYFTQCGRLQLPKVQKFNVPYLRNRNRCNVWRTNSQNTLDLITNNKNAVAEM